MELLASKLFVPPARTGLVARPRLVVAQVPTQGVFTLYSVIGDAFVWLCIAGVAALISWGIVRSRRARHAEGNETILTGPIADQAPLCGVLNRLRDLGLTLLSVNQVKPEDKEREEIQ